MNVFLKELKGKKLFRIILLSLVSLTFLIGIIKYLLDSPVDYFSLLLKSPPYYYVILFFLYLMSFIVLVDNQKRVIEPFNTKINYLESSRVTYIASIGNLVLPMRLGALARGIIFKVYYKLSLSEFVSTFVGITLVVLLINFAIGSFGIGYLLFTQAGLVSATTILQLLVFLAITGFLYLIIFVQTPYFLIENKILGNKYTSIVKKVIQGIEKIKEYEKLRRYIIVSMFWYTVISGLIFVVLANMIGVQINLFQALIYTSIYNITLMFSITPGALGLREGLLLIFGQILGLDIAQITFISLIDRLFLLITFVIFGFITEAISYVKYKSFFKVTSYNTK